MIRNFFFFFFFFKEKKNLFLFLHYSGKFNHTRKHELENKLESPFLQLLAGFTYHYKTELVFLLFGQRRSRGLTAQHYVDQVLRSIDLPFIVAHPRTVLQQDNARPHATRLTQNFLTTHNVPTLPWPALSPDLNPIEHVWDYMKRKIRSRNVHNVQQLRRAIADEWNNLFVRFLRRLVGSMSRKCTAVIRVHGGHTHY